MSKNAKNIFNKILAMSIDINEEGSQKNRSKPFALCSTP